LNPRFIDPAISRTRRFFGPDVSQTLTFSLPQAQPLSDRPKADLLSGRGYETAKKDANWISLQI
jgi:hypothetical protein